jgi:uncharacterized damage-inducible protein DinB
MTAQHYMGDATERAAAFLTHFIETTPPEKRDWTPSVEGAEGLRSMLDMAGECIYANQMFTGILKGEGMPAVHPIEAPRPFATWDEGKTLLAQSARELADTIRALTDDALAGTILTRRGEMPGTMVIEMASRNMNYHTGQVNLLQLLYGDTTFHFPAPKKQ